MTNFDEGNMKDLYERLSTKKIKVTEVAKWGPYFRNQWENHFVNHLSLQEKKEIYLYDDDGACGYLWHVFSFEKRECLSEEEAERAFNKQLKNKCFVFYQHLDDVLIIKKAREFEFSDLEDESDVYVVDSDFKWTYVKTHETGLCGPYFYKK